MDESPSSEQEGASQTRDFHTKVDVIAIEKAREYLLSRRDATRSDLDSNMRQEGYLLDNNQLENLRDIVLKRK